MPGLFNWDSGQSSPAPGGIGPGTLPNGTVRYQVIVTGASPFAPEYSTFLIDGIAGGKTHLNVNNGVSLELRADDKDNTGLGRNMLMNISTGQLNVAIGADALLYVQSGYGNVAIGVQTLEDLWTSTGTTGYNTAIGTNTARGINTGENNTIIGARVTGLGTALSNTVILADGAGLIRFQSNPTLTGKIIGAITAGKSLTLTATDDYNVTFAGTGTVSLSGHTHAGMGDISGTGIVGQVAEFVTNTKTLQAAKIIGPASNILTITNTAAATLALNIPAAGTFTLQTERNFTFNSQYLDSLLFSDDGEDGHYFQFHSEFGADTVFFLRYGSQIILYVNPAGTAHFNFVAGTILQMNTDLQNEGAAGILHWNGAYTLTIPGTGTSVLEQIATAAETWIGPSALDGVYFKPQANLLGNGGFETLGGAWTWTNWYNEVGNGAIADEGTLVHAGSHAAKLTAGSSHNTRIATFPTTLITFVPGAKYTLKFWTRGDGTNAGRYQLYDISNGWLDIIANTSTGITGTSYALITVDFTIPAGCTAAGLYFDCPTANGGICYFDDISITRRGSIVLGSLAGTGDRAVYAHADGTLYC